MKENEANLFKEIMAAHCEHQAQHIQTVCGL